MNYWKEAVECALEDAGLPATAEQIDTISKAIQISHDQYGMAYGYDCIPNPIELENKRLKKELEREKLMVMCRECNGRGSITENAWNACGRSSTSRCDKCNGEGKHPRNQI